VGALAGNIVPETAEPGSCCGSHVARPGREKKGRGGGGGSVGGADRWAGPGVGPSCKREGERMACGPGCNSKKFKIIQICSNLVRIKTSLSELKNFKIKYGFGGFEEMNYFLHRNFIRFKMNFELKIWEVKVYF
jgi:hypothetical protein